MFVRNTGGVGARIRRRHYVSLPELVFLSRDGYEQGNNMRFPNVCLQLLICRLKIIEGDDKYLVPSALRSVSTGPAMKRKCLYMSMLFLLRFELVEMHIDWNALFPPERLKRV